MSSHPVPLRELAAAVQSAVEQTLGKHGAVPIDKLWVGFVAPEAVATEDAANKIATKLGHQAGVKVQSSVAQLGAAAGSQTAHQAKLPAGHKIIGLIFEPRAFKE